MGGSFKSRATDVEAVISSSFAAEDFGAGAYQFLAYTAADPEAVMVQIRDLFGGTPNWSRTVEEFYSDALSTVGAFLRPMHSMIYFILLMAAVGVTNNLLINYMQKRRVTAMYKSVGPQQPPARGDGAWRKAFSVGPDRSGRCGVCLLAGDTARSSWWPGPKIADGAGAERRDVFSQGRSHGDRV